MVQSTSLIVAVATVATVLYTANPALGASVPVVRRDDEMDLVTRANKAHKHDKQGKAMVAGHSATWWHKLYQERSKDFLRVIKLFELYIKKGSSKDKKAVLKKLVGVEKKAKSDDKSSKKDEKSTSFKASKEKAEKEKKSDKKARDVEDELFVRDLEDDDLFARDFDSDDLLAREFEEDLFARDFESDDLVTRDLFEGMSEIEARDFIDALTELDARDFDLFERSDIYDDLD